MYAQGVDALIRLVYHLADCFEELEAQPIHSPQPLIASFSKELAKAKRMLARQSQELLEQRQLNHRQKEWEKRRVDAFPQSPTRAVR
jgi:hypothetical protein